jgi:hypothetical protein
MAATTFLVFYRFKSMNSDEAAKAKSEWNDLRKTNSLVNIIMLA